MLKIIATKVVSAGFQHFVNIHVYAIEYEPPHGKTNNLHNAKTAKLISAFVFATRMVQFLFYLNPKFPASNLLL